MYESREEYEAVVRRKVLILERHVGYAVRHGEDGVCPRCGSAGTFDIDGLGFIPDSNSIYYSTVHYDWRCRVCDFRSCS